MLTRIDEAKRVLGLAKQLVAEHKALERIQARRVTTPKAGVAQSTDLTFQAAVIVRVEASLHAACVDAGLADLRSPEHYAPRVSHMGGFHDHRFEPARPKSLAEPTPTSAGGRDG